MTCIVGIRRVRPCAWIWLAVLISGLGAVPGRSLAQVRPDTVPADTARRDSVVVGIPPEAMVRDTVPADSVRPATPDSLLPAPSLPQVTRPYTPGFAHARWEWDRQELARYHGLSLVELLERIPGLIVTRTGGFGRPAGLSFLDTGGGTVRVFRDGFEVDPLVAGTLDLQHIGLADVQAVRVERFPAEIRIELSTLQLDDRRPFSQIEAATGNAEAKILRALFARPVGTRNVFSAAYDLTSTNGFTADEPFAFGSARLRWTHALSERVGLQAEYRQASVERGGSLFSEQSRRRELVLRGRARLLPGLTLDGLVGRTTQAPQESDDAGQGGRDAGRTDDPLGLRLATTQAALRASYLLGSSYLEATGQVRGGELAGRFLPGADLSIRGVVQPLRWVGLEAEARSTGMEQGQATRLSGTARLGAIAGFSVFTSVSAGERWAPVIGDTTEVRVGQDSVTRGGVRQPRADTVPVPMFGATRASASGLRAGVEWAGWGARLGAALVSSGADVAAPYGFAFDRDIGPVNVGQASGIEAYATVPVPFWWPGLRLDGWYVTWQQLGNRPYLPVEQARLGLEFHGVFVEGEFEPTLRVDAVYRGSALAPSPDRSRYGQGTEAYTMANLFLQIRILDVRAFFIFENFLNDRVASDVPGTNLAGPRMLYGLRWHFRN